MCVSSSVKREQGNGKKKFHKNIVGEIFKPNLYLNIHQISNADCAFTRVRKRDENIPVEYNNPKKKRYTALLLSTWQCQILNLSSIFRKKEKKKKEKYAKISPPAILATRTRKIKRKKKSSGTRKKKNVFVYRTVRLTRRGVVDASRYIAPAGEMTSPSFAYIFFFFLHFLYFLHFFCIPRVTS